MYFHINFIVLNIISWTRFDTLNYLSIILLHLLVYVFLGKHFDVPIYITLYRICCCLQDTYEDDLLSKAFTGVLESVNVQPGELGDICVGNVRDPASSITARFAQFYRYY